MNLIKWNPWREMDTFSDRFNHFFDSPIVPASWLKDGSKLHDWAPSVDVYDDEKKFVIKAEIPGVDKKDIHIDVKDRVLTLSGERSHETHTLVVVNVGRCAILAGCTRTRGRGKERRGWSPGASGIRKRRGSTSVSSIADTCARTAAAVR